MSLVIIGTKTSILQYQEFNIQFILYHVTKLHWMDTGYGLIPYITRVIVGWL
jgi:hypothetical protein